MCVTLDYQGKKEKNVSETSFEKEVLRYPFTPDKLVFPGL
jgi:hypothetical protein